MNHLLIPLCWSALQVSALTLAGLFLSILAARRAPATAAFLIAVTLVGCCALTVLAFTPLPDWYTWTPRAARPESSPVQPSDVLPVPTSQEAEVSHHPSSAPSGIPLAWPRLPAPSLTASAEGRSPSRWPALVVGAFVVGVAVGLGRLLLSVWALRRLVRRTQPIGDRSLLELVERLRVELGVRSVGLRECPELTSAATAGWWRPQILLPAEWPLWDLRERQAVLAHELAHVARHDGLAWLLARFCLVLHFYHPLVYWLVNRLQLHQELAADAVGVRCVGGSQPYLRVLARMALRQDDRSAVVPARAFLSSPGTLLKRITMLKVRDGQWPVSASRGVRALAWIALLATAFGLSTLRSPAAKPDPQESIKDSATPVTASEASEVRKAELPPFDLTYLAPDADGVCAFRPAALFQRPELKQYRELLNQYLDGMLAGLTGKKGATWDVRIEDLDQIVGSMYIQAVPKTKPDEPVRNALMYRGIVFKTTRNHDWKKTLSLMTSNLKEVKIEGRTCYQLTLESVPAFANAFLFYVADEKTLVCDTKDGLPALLRAGKTNTPRPALAEQWTHVDRCTMAMAMKDIRTMVAGRTPDKDEEFPITQLLQVSKGLAVGANLDDTLRCQLVVKAATETDAMNIVAEVPRQMKRGLELGKKPAEKSTAEEAKLNEALTHLIGGSAIDREAIIKRMLTEVCGGYTIERDGTLVHWQGKARMNAVEILSIWPGWF
jgi:beta-lactamase regulating signal transducer with metallopeptidase domain